MKAPILSAYTGLQERPESCDMERGYTAVLLYQKSGPPSRATTVLFFVGNGEWIMETTIGIHSPLPY